MIRRPPIFTSTAPLFPSTTLVRLQRIRGWQRIAADPVNRPEIQEGKGAGVEEAHVAGAAGRQAALQVLLQRRAQVLHEGGENGDRNPELEQDRKSTSLKSSH